MEMHLRIVELEARQRRLERALRWSLLGCLLLALLGIAAWSQPDAAPSSLRVSELVVVDGKGVERVRIGGELPDALIGGKKVPRGERAAGVLLYDASGGERSGYVTFEPSGNVGLTLDTRTRQVAFFVADPEEGSALQLWHGNSLVELRADDDGARLSAAADRKVVAQHPVVERMSPATCQAYKEAGSRVSADQVMADCRRRFQDAACGVCLSP